jgi:hypothetical protein
MYNYSKGTQISPSTNHSTTFSGENFLPQYGHVSNFCNISRGAAGLGNLILPFLQPQRMKQLASSTV